MNSFHAFLLLIPVLSLHLPQPVHQPHPPSSVLTNCIIENSRHGQDSVNDCTECFDKTSSNPLSKEAIPQVKACIAQFLPMSNDNCQDAIAALEPDDLDKAKKVLDCFGNTAKKVKAEECILENINGPNNIIDALTFGVICIDENITMNFDNNGKHRFNEKIKHELNINFPSLCEIASQTKHEFLQCNRCFNELDTLDNLSSPAYFGSIAECSEKNLDPIFRDCTEMIKHLIDNYSDEALSQVGLCSQKVLIKYSVALCSDGIDIISVDNLLAVAECANNLVRK